MIVAFTAILRIERISAEFHATDEPACGVLDDTTSSASGYVCCTTGLRFTLRGISPRCPGPRFERMEFAISSHLTYRPLGVRDAFKMRTFGMVRKMQRD